MQTVRAEGLGVQLECSPEYRPQLGILIQNCAAFSCNNNPDIATPRCCINCCHWNRAGSSFVCLPDLIRLASGRNFCTWTGSTSEGPRGLFGFRILLICDWVRCLLGFADSNQRLICRQVALGFVPAYVLIAWRSSSDHAWRWWIGGMEVVLELM